MSQDKCTECGGFHKSSMPHDVVRASPTPSDWSAFTTVSEDNDERSKIDALNHHTLSDPNGKAVIMTDEAFWKLMARTLDRRPMPSDASVLELSTEALDDVMNHPSVVKTWAYYDNVAIPSRDDARHMVAAILRAGRRISARGVRPSPSHEALTRRPQCERDALCRLEPGHEDSCWPDDVVIRTDYEDVVQERDALLRLMEHVQEQGRLGCINNPERRADHVCLVCEKLSEIIVTVGASESRREP